MPNLYVSPHFFFLFVLELIYKQLYPVEFYRLVKSLLMIFMFLIIPSAATTTNVLLRERFLKSKHS